MKLNVQKRLAADALKCGLARIKFDSTRLSEIKEAITKYDIKALVNTGAIKKEHKKGVSRGRARVAAKKKSKGRRRGHGSRKGRATARTHKKEEWMNRVRLQRKFLKSLKDGEKIDNKTYRALYRKSKGGFFRSKRHIKLYIEEHKLI